VASGTAANSLALSSLCPPWGAVLCHESAHIIVNEGGATSLFSGGGVMRGLPGAGYLVDPQAMQQVFDRTNWGDPHHSQPAVLSLTCPTDMGTVYSPAQITELTAQAHARGLRTHLDGARLANGIVAQQCSPATLITNSGIDAFSLGAIKNGALSTDAIVCFQPEASEQLVYRVKRAGHVASKMRFQSAQLVAYLTDGLWLRLAQRANDAMEQLSTGLRALDVELLAEPEANMLFAQVGTEAIARLSQQGLLFYDMPGGVLRFVTSFQTTADEIAEVLRRAEVALS
jgi:threonine aldolase